MSLWDRLTGEFIDVIDWTTDDGDTMVWRFERYGNEIKHGAKLTVREGQAAVFVNEGQIADVFPPGMYMLETNNLPVLSTLQSWDHGFQSPFKAEIYFVSLKQFTDLKWGTKNPVMLRDSDFGPTRLRAFGTYAIRVADPRVFLSEIVGTDGEFTTGEIQGQLRNIIVSRFSNAIASSGIPVLDLAANYDDLGKFAGVKIGEEMGEYGLSLTKLLVENVSLPPEVEKAMDRRTQMGVIGDLQKYTQFQAAESMRAAAENPGEGGGAASAGIGAGIGMAMGGMMGNAMGGMGQHGAEQGGSVPPPLPPRSRQWHVAVDGASTGPHGQDSLASMAASGRLTRESLVWSDGMAAWERAGSVDDLDGVFGATPPPLPSAGN